MPAYNEQATIRTIVARVLAVDLGPVEKELVIVDDGSKDGTRDDSRRSSTAKTASACSSSRTTRARARRCGAACANRPATWSSSRTPTSNTIPREYTQLIRPILDGEADVVYGSRFLGSPRGHRVLYFWHSVGNRLLTTLSNMFSDLNLTDMETCYKVMVRKRRGPSRSAITRLRHRAGDHAEGRGDARARLRGADLVSRPHL